MKTTRLGTTGLEVSRVGIGGIPIQRPPKEEAIRVVRRALDLGITLIDTARGYGESEARIGEAIQGRRDEVVIVTRTWKQDKEGALAQLEESLQNLNTDYIDVWQFHNVSTFAKYDQVFGPTGAMEAAQAARDAGKIRHIGISSHSLEVARKAVALGFFEVLLFPFNFVNDEAARELLPLVRERGVGFMAMKPFAGGRLMDAGLVLKYLLQFDDAIPVPGIETVPEIEEIVDIVNGPWDLAPRDRQRMDEIRDD